MRKHTEHQYQPLIVIPGEELYRILLSKKHKCFDKYEDGETGDTIYLFCDTPRLRNNLDKWYAGRLQINARVYFNAMVPYPEMKIGDGDNSAGN